MSVRVNLIPEGTKKRAHRSRQRRYALGAAVALFAAVAGVHLWAIGQVDQARVELAAAEARTGELRGEVTELQEYQVLARRQQESDAAIQHLLGSEYSLAGVLQDVAAAMPGDTQLDTLSVTSVDPEAMLLEVDAPAATFSATGRTLESHAPGVERLLLGMDSISTFRHMYVTSSTIDEPGEDYSTYTLEGEISPMARTGRYAIGLPEAMR